MGEWYCLAFRTDQDDLAFYSEGRVVTPHSVWTGVKSFIITGTWFLPEPIIL